MKDKSFKMTELIWKFPAAIPPTLFRTYVGFFNLLISCSHEPSQNWKQKNPHKQQIKAPYLENKEIQLGVGKVSKVALSYD